MTSRTSSRKVHPVNSFFKFSLKKQTPITLLVTAFTLLISPGLLISEIANHTVFDKYNLDADEFVVYSIIILVAASLLSFMLLLQNFGFLYSKKAGDMYNALPLTRNEMLFSRSLSSFVGAFFTMNVTFILLVLVNCLPSVYGVSLLLVVKCYLMMCLSLLVITAFFLLFIICSGGYFDAIIALGAINLGPVAVLAILFLTAEESTVGLNMDYSWLIYVNPVAYMVFKLACLPVYENPNYTPTALQSITVFTILGIAVFGILCIIAAVKLFKIRKSETAGDAYSFKFMPAIISTLISMVGGYLIGGVLTGFSTNFDIIFWFFFIIGALLCGIAFGAITNRGFKKVKSSLVNGAVSAAVMIALVCASSAVAAYAESRIPDVDKIEKIYLGYGEDVVFTDGFETWTELHKSIIECLKEEHDDTYEEFPSFVQNIKGLNFTYVMKNGSEINRYYNYRMPDMESLNPQLLKLMQSEEFLASFDDCAANNGYGIITINPHGKFGSLDADGSNHAIITVTEAKEMLELFKEDLRNASAETVFKGEVYGLSVDGDEYRDIYIHSSFTKTVEYVTQLFEAEKES